MTSGPLSGMTYQRVAVEEADYLVAVGGSGPPVLLLHGYPQTHFCWHRVAPGLAASHTVVAADLRGYGGTAAPPGGPHGEGFSKREIASELVQVMSRLGFDRFAVAGHDRGGRVAYRMALDHPERVERLAVLNIVPTVDQFERMTPDSALDYFPWFFLAQPAPLPERLIESQAEFFLQTIFDSWPASPESITAEARGQYLAAFTPRVIAASCADYRAAFHIDRRQDAEDLAAGRRISCPVLVLWGASELAPEPDASGGPLAVWRRWADDVRGRPLASGHFIPEEAPERLLEALGDFLG